MIVCLCEGLNDRTLRSAISSGCRTVRELADATGAAKGCGSCACDLRTLLAEQPSVPEGMEPVQEALPAK